jgi:hypothetical protein
MRRGVFAKTSALLIFGSLGIGCSSSSAPPPNSFTQVYEQVLAQNCSNAYCHFNFVGVRMGALDMSSPTYAYWNLVDQPARGPSCTTMGRRVVPFNPQTSILYSKVSQEMPLCGVQMPADPGELLTDGRARFSGHALSADQQQLIFNWISEGAQNN